MQKRAFAISFALLLLIGAFFRFAFLDWGRPFFFHPDENNITNAIAQLSFQQWNPHFFAYGSLPIYFTFFLSHIISMGKPSYATIAYTLRFISATLSLLLIPSLYYIGKQMYDKQIGFITAVLATFGTGFIQYAHFGTFEMWLSFFTLWFFYFCFLLWEKQSKKNIFFISLFGGILFAIKISSLVLLPVPIFILLIKKRGNIKELFAVSFFYCLTVGILYVITNPFILIMPSDVLNALHYESAVALGTVSVFYTQSFLHTVPLLYQLQYVFPFLLNPFVFIVSFLGFFFLAKQVMQKPKMQDMLILLFLLVIILSQTFFYVKWNRYMMPSIPFAYLAAGIFLQKMTKRFSVFLISTLTAISALYAVILLFTVYQTDSRINAAVFAKKHISSQSAIIEPYDLGILPFYQVFPHQTVINLYDIDTVLPENDDLQTALQNNAIFIELSQRLSRVRLKNQKDFPNGYKLYRTLTDSRQYKIVYQTPCNILCKILYNGNPFYNIEETASVFDHPMVTIFEKI